MMLLNWVSANPWLAFGAAWLVIIAISTLCDGIVDIIKATQKPTELENDSD